MQKVEIKPASNKYVVFDFEADINGKEHEIDLSVSTYLDDPTPIVQ